MGSGHIGKHSDSLVVYPSPSPSPINSDSEPRSLNHHKNDIASERILDGGRQEDMTAFASSFLLSLTLLLLPRHQKPPFSSALAMTPNDPTKKPKVSSMRFHTSKT